MAEPSHREWQVPSFETSESYRLGWLNEACAEGEAWNSSQRGFRDWRKGLSIISGDESRQDLLTYRSQLSGRRLKTNIRTAISGLANIRPLWGYHASKNYANYAAMLNKTARALYLEGFWDQSVKEALAYAAATCSGWLRPVYMRDQAGKGKGNIRLLSYGMPCVLPVQVPSDGDFQEAYAVSLLDEMPIYMAHAKFPDFQDRLHPTSSRYWYSADIRGAAKGNAWKRMTSWFRRRETDRLSDLFIPIRWTTVIDHRLNETGATIGMGEPGSPWYYEVPSYGQDISDGQGGSRKADENDSRMYPYRRQMISSEECIMYDGPAFNWHGQLDLIQFTVDKWPWEPNGFSMVHDGWELQRSIDQVDRGIMDRINAQADLPLGYDLNAVTKREAESFDPMEPRARIAFDGSQVDRPFAPPVDPEVYRVSTETLAWRDKMNEELDYQMQIRDIVELGKARALGKGMDQIEALIAANGPVVKDIARSMENSLGRVGNQVGWLILQFMTTSRLMQYVGPENMVQEVFDYDPASIVPSHLPGEDPHDAEQRPQASKYSKMQRARWFAENLRFFLMPHSVHEITQMTYRLLLLQLKARGFSISDYTVMSSCDVPDLVPPDGNSEQERWKSEQEDKVLFAARMQAIVQGLGIDPAAAGGAGGGGGKQSGTTSKGGRPPTDKVAPHLVQKDGGARSTVSSS